MIETVSDLVPSGEPAEERLDRLAARMSELEKAVDQWIP